MISNMQAVSVGPTLISISATGVNVQPQALNVSPDLIVVGPYDTTIAGQVVSFCHSCALLPALSIFCHMLWQTAAQDAMCKPSVAGHLAGSAVVHLIQQNRPQVIGVRVSVPCHGS